MIFKSKYWKNLFYVIAGLFLMVFIFELYPGIVDNFGLLQNYLSQSSLDSEIIAKNEGITNLQSENLYLKKSLKYELNGNKKKLSGQIAYFSEAAENSGVKITTIKPGIIISENNFDYQPVELNITGTYKSLYSFIFEIEKREYLIFISKLEMSSPVQEGSELGCYLSLKVY